MHAESHQSAMTLTNIWKAESILMFLLMNDAGHRKCKLLPIVHMSELTGEVGSDFTGMRTPGSESAKSRDVLWVVSQGGQ